MQRSSPLPIWLLVLNAGLVMAVTMLSVRVWTLQETALPKKQMTALRLVMKEVLDHHIESHDAAALLDEAIDGLVHSLDTWSDYVPAKEVKGFEENNTGTYEGIGVTMLTEGGPPTVLYPHPGGPAERAGLMPGDRILAVAGNPIPANSRPNPPLHEQVRGKAGTKVSLTIARGEEPPRDFEVTREGVLQPSVRWARLVDAAAKVGYLHLSTFQPSSCGELDAAVEGLVQRGAQALVLDLRDNPGGLLDQAVKIANRFVAAGNIVTLRKRGGDVEETHDAKPELCRWPTLPLVVIVDRYSASASEVLAGALQDHGRARIVGERSYGKGFVQSIYRWQDHDFRLRLTTGHYYTPSGRDLDRRMRPVRSVDQDTGRTGIRWEPISASEQKDPPSGGIIPDEIVSLDSTTTDKVRQGLAANEVPERWREQVQRIAKLRNYPIRGPVQEGQDTQLARAIAVAAGLPPTSSRPASIESRKASQRGGADGK